jgi:hypothetical protein
MSTVSFGDGAEFNALVYGPKHQGTFQYLQDQVQQFSTATSEFGKVFYAKAKAMFEIDNGEDAMRAARAAMRKVGNMFVRDDIRYIDTIGGLQQAQSKMQRFIMAEPTVRQTYHNQRCDGYSDTYRDLYPADIGESHYDYRRVTDKMVMETPEDDWKVTTHFECLVADDRDLTFEEKHDVLSTWEIISRRMRSGGDDPTSPTNSRL